MRLEKVVDDVPEEPLDDPELLWQLYREREWSQRTLSFELGVEKEEALKALIEHDCLKPWANREKLQKALEEYGSPEAVANEWNTSEITIRRWMDRHGIKKRIELTEELLRELYVSQNLTEQEVAEDTHRTPVEVHFKLKEFGIETRDGSHRFR